MLKSEWKITLWSTHISGLDGELNIIIKSQLLFHFCLWEVEKDLLNYISSFNETKALLHGADHTLVFYWMCRVLQPNMAGPQVTTATQTNWSTTGAMPCYCITQTTYKEQNFQLRKVRVILNFTADWWLSGSWLCLLSTR